MKSTPDSQKANHSWLPVNCWTNYWTANFDM